VKKNSFVVPQMKANLAKSLYGRQVDLTDVVIRLLN
jgi:hypothetical protein